MSGGNNSKYKNFIIISWDVPYSQTSKHSSEMPARKRKLVDKENTAQEISHTQNMPKLREKKSEKRTAAQEKPAKVGTRKQVIEEDADEALTEIVTDKGNPWTLEFMDIDQAWLKLMSGTSGEAQLHKTLTQLSKLHVLKKRIFPPPDMVFSWTRLCKPEDVRVVILGQDPYHDNGQAHGLCFSVPEGIKMPPSLVNIFKELTTDIPGFVRPANGNLTKWARQGVLLLNATLTVEAHKANSHESLGWNKFTDDVIDHLNNQNDNIVFILWGQRAAAKTSKIDQSKHLILTSVHPSPLSAHRGFFGNRHFSKASEYLIQHGRKPIDWIL